MDEPGVVRFPTKLKGLFRPYRYKVAYGGRGSGKSWAFARALLTMGAGEKLRMLCTREVQKSLADSVMALLEDQIGALGLGGFYEVQKTLVRGRNGTEFLFAGLSSQTAESIKSFEGVDIVWCEEAQTISKVSWDILIPTIRKDGSEIWISFNPSLETDETYRRFVTTPPPNSLVVHINWSDNPWFPQVLEDERIHCQATSPMDYPNIWEGLCRSAVSGAIYASEVAISTLAGRICNLPYDPHLKVHAVWDMGFGDWMAVTMVQVLRSEIRVIDYLQVRQKRTDEVVAMLQSKLYNWGYDFLPHDGFHTVRGTGCSDADTLKRMKRKVKQTPNIPKEDGIRNARNTFHRIYFDRTNTVQLMECLKRYRRAETKNGGDGHPVHDEFSDGADSFRYLCLNIDKMSNEDDGFLPQFGSFEPLNAGMGY